MVTALLLTQRESLPVLKDMPKLVTWLLPTIVGTPLIVMVQRRFRVR